MRKQTLVIEIEVEAPDYLTDFAPDDEDLSELRYEALGEVLNAALNGLAEYGYRLRVCIPHQQMLNACIHTKAVYLATGGRG